MMIILILLCGLCSNSSKLIFQGPERTMDAPGVVDNFYSNLLDWSSSNILAIALGNSVYLWNPSDHSTVKLVTIEDEDGPVTSISWALDGQHIAVGLDNSWVQLWDSVAVRLVRTLLLLIIVGCFPYKMKPWF